jgi:basic membrane protein A
VCKPSPEMTTRLKQIEQDIESGKIKVSEG